MIKKTFRKIHIYASVFFLPMALLFSITGILYICGIQQDFQLKKQEFHVIHNNHIADKEAFVLSFLQENNIPLPTQTSLKYNKKLGNYTMGSTKYFITFSQQPNHITITTNTRSFIGNLIMLHKAKVKEPFIIFSIIFSIALLLFYFSGFIMTSWAKQNRKASIITFLSGLIITSILAIISL